MFWSGAVGWRRWDIHSERCMGVSGRPRRSETGTDEVTTRLPSRSQSSRGVRPRTRTDRTGRWDLVGARSRRQLPCAGRVPAAARQPTGLAQPSPSNQRPSIHHAVLGGSQRSLTRVARSGPNWRDRAVDTHPLPGTARPHRGKRTRVAASVGAISSLPAKSAPTALICSQGR